MGISKKRKAGLFLMAVVVTILTGLLSGCGEHVCHDTPLGHQIGCDEGGSHSSGGNSG